MNRDFLNQRQADLIELRNQLMNGIEFDHSDLAGWTCERDTEAADCDLDFVTCVLASRTTAKLHEIEEGLDRITAGGYGQCNGCNEQIHPERLKVRPWVQLCIDCQRMEESHHRHNGSG